MTDAQPHTDDQQDDTEAQCEEEWPEGKEYDYTPLAREDFGPDGQWAWEMFSAFREHLQQGNAESIETQ